MFRPIHQALPIGTDQGAAQATRNKLLRSGIACFAELGFHAASTRIVEGAAGVNRNLIAHHWGTKLEFWKACVNVLASAFGGELLLAGAHSVNVNGAERLRFFVRAFIRASAKYPEVHSIMLDEGKRDEDRLQWLVDRHARVLKEHMGVLLGEANHLGVALEIDLPSFYYSLVGSAAIFSMKPECGMLFGKDPFDEEVVARHANAVAAMLIPDEMARA